MRKLEKMTKFGLSNVSIKLEANLNLIVAMIVSAILIILVWGEPDLLQVIIRSIASSAVTP